MGTSNFHCVNASQIFSIIPEQDELELYDYDIESDIDYVTDMLRGIDGFTTNTKTDPHELWSYPSRGICSIVRYVSLPDIDTEVEITVGVVVRSGYYEGVNFDWFVDFEQWGSFTEWQVLEEMIEPDIQRIVDEVEDVLREATQPLVTVGRFSNGETVYSPA